jgi:hypothetical protein
MSHVVPLIVTMSSRVLKKHYKMYVGAYGEHQGTEIYKKHIFYPFTFY